MKHNFYSSGLFSRSQHFVNGGPRFLEGLPVGKMRHWQQLRVEVSRIAMLERKMAFLAGV
jgi:hypothetical protein